MVVYSFMVYNENLEKGRGVLRRGKKFGIGVDFLFIYGSYEYSN